MTEPNGEHPTDEPADAAPEPAEPNGEHPPEAAGPVLEAQGITHRFAGIRALDKVSLTV